MKHTRACWVVAWALLALLPSLSYGTIPQAINYQGRLTNAVGASINDTVDLIFRICADSLCSSQLWSESHSGVIVKDGLFDVLLGSTDPIQAAVFDGSVRFLSISLDGTPMTRRLPMTSVGYAYHSLVSDSARYAPSAGNGWVDDGTVVRLATGTDSVGIGTSSPATKFQVGSAASTRQIAQLEGLTLIRTNGTGQPVTLKLMNLNGTANSGVSIDLEGLNASSMSKGAGRIAALLTDQTALNEKSALTFSTADYADDGLAERVRIDRDGNVGIGTSSPTEKLDVNGRLKVRTVEAGTGTDLVVDAGGVIKKASSSERYKDRIESLSTDPEQVLKLKPVSFQWKSTGEQDIGLLAEQVAKLVPELVIYDDQGQPDAVKYDKITLYLLKIVKVQQEQINSLTKKLEELTTK